LRCRAPPRSLPHLSASETPFSDHTSCHPAPTPHLLPSRRWSSASPGSPH
jgi:hypothetical protein